MDDTSALAAFLGSLSPAMRRRTGDRLRSLTVRKGQALLARGGSSAEVFFVLEGRLAAVLYAANGREVALRSLESGAMFGELAAVDGLARSSSVVAETEARVAALPRPDFLACLDDSPAAALWLARHLAGQVRAMTERVFELSALNIQTRLHCELLRLARTAPARDGIVRIEPAPSHAELASRIGSNREAVTRELRSLTERALIRSGRRSLHVLDLPGLERSALRLGSTPA